jgi:hypothetical protein
VAKEESLEEKDAMMTEAALSLRRAINDLELLRAMYDLPTGAYAKVGEAIRVLREAEREERAGQ